MSPTFFVVFSAVRISSSMAGSSFLRRRVIYPSGSAEPAVPRASPHRLDQVHIAEFGFRRDNRRGKARSGKIPERALFNNPGGACCCMPRCNPAIRIVRDRIECRHVESLDSREIFSGHRVYPKKMYRRDKFREHFIRLPDEADVEKAGNRLRVQKGAYSAHEDQWMTGSSFRAIEGNM